MEFHVFSRRHGNTLDDCDILEKVMDLSSRYKNNDVMVTIKVQQFRSRYAKYVHYKYTRVVCECHGSKREREPSRIHVKKSQKTTDKRSVWRCIIKKTPKSSKMHHLDIKYTTSCKEKNKSSVRFVNKVRKKNKKLRRVECGMPADRNGNRKTTMERP